MTRPTLLPLRRSRRAGVVAVPAAMARSPRRPSARPADAAPVAARVTASPTSSTGSGATTLYVVQPGDTLTSVAARTGTDIATLVRLNGWHTPTSSSRACACSCPSRCRFRAPRRRRRRGP